MAALLLLVLSTTPAQADDAAELKSAFTQICASLAGDRIRAVELVVRLPRAGGQFDPYPIYLRGEEAVEEAVKRLAVATPGRKGAAPADAKKREAYIDSLDCRLVYERDPNVVELEKRGDLLLELLAEDDKKPGTPSAPRLVAGPLVMLSVEPARLEFLRPSDPPLAGVTVEAGKLRELLKAAVDEDAKRAAEFWGDTLPYGMARSSLAEGIAYERLGCRPQAAEAFRRCADLCKKHQKWEYLAADAAARLTALGK